MAVVGFRKILAGCVVAGLSCAAAAADVYPIEGSLWRVTAINGEATPNSKYSINFGGNQVTGRLGCNDFGGNLAVKEGSLNISALRATSRVCGDDAAAFEGSGLAVISQPLSLQWAGRDRLVIASVNGNMTLERLP
jgi:heat shock protein HslJ